MAEAHWTSGMDYELLREALRFEAQIKEVARREEVTRHVAEHLQESFNQVMRQPRTVPLVEEMQAQLRQTITEMEDRLCVPEKQRVGRTLKVEIDKHDPTSINIFLPRKPTYIELNLVLGDVVDEVTEDWPK